MLDPLQTLKTFVSFPSVSADPAFAAGMQGARDFLAQLLRGMGLTVEVVPTDLHPIILARREGPPEWPHVIIYGHYDVQPPDPLALWTTPPFEPTERDGRLYGRGTADNKGPLTAHLAALDRVLRSNPDLPLRITLLIEGEEEIGSPSFLPFLEAHRRDLAADLVLLSDTGSPNPDQIVITTGLRGMVTCEIELAGPRMDLHSGLHGGALMNPIQALAQLCASLHSEDGRVAIPGFYDAVVEVEPWERDELARLKLDPVAYARFLGIERFHTVPGYSPFEAVRFLPTLEFNGIGGGYQGEGTKTIIPSRARAKISCRLVPRQDPQQIQELLFGTLRDRCPPGVTLSIVPGHLAIPYHVVPPGRPNTPADQSPALARAFRATDQAVAEVFGRAPLYLREGGSVPIIADIKRVLGMDSILFGLFLPEDNLHAPDESFDLTMMSRGSAVSEKVLQALAAGPRRSNS